MDSYKVKVNNEQESEEVQELFFELGFGWHCGDIKDLKNLDMAYLYTYDKSKDITCGSNESYFINHENKEITIQQLKDLVVLKRNDVGDATHTSGNYQYYLTSSEFFEYRFGKWVNVDEYVEGVVFEPIEKKEMKEFLVKYDDKWTLQLLDSDTEENSYRVAVPSGAEIYAVANDGLRTFWSDDYQWYDGDITRYIKQEDPTYTFREWKADWWAEILWQRSETEYLMQCENGNKLMEGIAELNNQDTVKVSIDELKHRVGVDATLAERQATYGSFEDVAFVTENVMGVLSKARPNGLSDLPHTHRMALYMIASKMARIVNGDFNHLDSWHDIGGYAKLIENLIGDKDE